MVPSNHPELQPKSTARAEVSGTRRSKKTRSPGLAFRRSQSLIPVATLLCGIAVGGSGVFYFMRREQGIETAAHHQRVAELQRDRDDQQQLAARCTEEKVAAVKSLEGRVRHVEERLSEPPIRDQIAELDKKLEVLSESAKKAGQEKPSSDTADIQKLVTISKQAIMRIALKLGVETDPKWSL